MPEGSVIVNNLLNTSARETSLVIPWLRIYYTFWTSLVGQWIGTHLPRQETQVLPLVWGRFHKPQSH